MATKEATKKNQSSMQVLKTLQLLLQDNYTMSELISKLNENEKDSIFNNSVVSKYINTCRYCGIDIPKIHNKYFVASIPFGLDLSSRELDLIEELQYAVKNLLPKSSDKVFDKFITNLSKYCNKRIMRVEPKSMDKVFMLFEAAVAEQRKVRLMFRAKAVFECVPLGIVEKKGKKCFHIIHKGKEKTISSERISGIEVVEEKFEHRNAGEVIFKLKGPLAERYSLREHEKIVTNELPTSIVVSNKGESKEALFSRLLRYDTCCEILYPVQYREEMKQLIDEMLKNYEE